MTSSTCARRTIGCVALLLCIAACKSLEDGAREAFSKDYSCPENRITVRPRADLNAYDVTFGTSTAAPPADVKKDPERLALWQAQQREKRAAWNDRISVYEARGCGHDAIYTCSHPDGRKGGANYARAACSKANEQPGETKK
jgi:hypothetical protein